MNTEWWVWLFTVVIYILLAVMLIVVPIAPNRSALFGVYVPEGERETADVRNAGRRYTRFMLIVFIIGAVAAAVLGWIGYFFPAGFFAAVAVLIAGAIVATLNARRAMLRIGRERAWEQPQAVRRVADLNFRSRRLTIGYGWFTVHLVLIAASVIYVITMWDRIPDSFATHYDMSGEADSYSVKSFGSVFMLNMMQLLMTVLFIFVNLSIRMAKQQLDPKNPEKSMEGQRRFRMANSIFLYGLSLFIVILFGYIQGSSLFGWQVDIIITVSVALPVLLLAALLGMLYYFRKNHIDTSQGAGLTEESHWKLGGAFYYNKEDSALFVAKRYGIGWTVNVGQPMGLVILGVMLLVPLAVLATVIIAAAVTG